MGPCVRTSHPAPKARVRATAASRTAVKWDELWGSATSNRPSISSSRSPGVKTPLSMSRSYSTRFHRRMADSSSPIPSCSARASSHAPWPPSMSIFADTDTSSASPRRAMMRPVDGDTSFGSARGGPGMYDLVLKAGRVVDPSSGFDGVLDVAVENGAIARVAAGIAPAEAARVIDVGGKLVTPGLIDLHAHVFDGFNRTGVNPDLGGVHAGVTTIVDAGSAGAATFGGWRHILPNCATEIVPFLHICQTGLATLPDIIAESSVNLTDTVKVATEKRYDPKVIHPLLDLLEPGDILTHYFTPNPGGVLDGNGKLVPEAREAASRGVWFDTAHGRMNFSFDVGRRIIDQGLLPHCISTDLTVPGRVMTVHSMTEMMTRFLGLGFTLPQVVTMSTTNPAKAIGEEGRLRRLAVGRQADISVLEVKEGDWVVYDILGSGLRVERAFARHLTVKRGQLFTPDFGPRPWGWLPDRAVAGGCC